MDVDVGAEDAYDDDDDDERDEEGSASDAAEGHSGDDSSDGGEGRWKVCLLCRCTHLIPRLLSIQRGKVLLSGPAAVAVTVASAPGASSCSRTGTRGRAGRRTETGNTAGEGAGEALLMVRIYCMHTRTRFVRSVAFHYSTSWLPIS